MSNEQKNKIDLEQEAVVCGAAISSGTMEQFLTNFEQSTKRWEKAVYPAMIAFFILAAYGFFLIFSLTRDIHTIAHSIDPNMGQNMEMLASRMETMTLEISAMRGNLQQMSSQMQSLDQLQPMVMHMANMDKQMGSMVFEANLMRQDMHVVTTQIARPMSMMNSWIPW
ncbi:MAG: hypothetical protein ACWA5R_15085 [bacterium]